MKIRDFLAVSAVFMSCVSCADRNASKYETEFQRLDGMLEMSDEYLQMKLLRVATIENMLESRGLTPMQQYNIYGQLFQEYKAFQFDKAISALDHQLLLADEMRDRTFTDDALIDKAHLLTVAGFYLEADRVFSSIDTLSLNFRQKTDWYSARQKFLYDYNEYVRSSDFKVADVDKIGYYQDMVLANTSQDSQINRQMRMMRLIEQGQFETANDENLKYIQTLNKDEHAYAIHTYWQGFICENLERTDEVIYWWTESAICDIKGAVKDNAALCSIAVKLNSPEDTDRAFKYIRISLDDALYFNAKLRKVQIASTMPWIQDAYEKNRMKQNRDRNKFLAFTLAAVLLLSLVLAFLVRMYFKGLRSAAEIQKQSKKLEEYNRSIIAAEEDLRKINLELTEANIVKEEYLGLFLSMCSGYLDKLRKTISREQYEAELKSFYKTFDTSFLSLYPTFVDDFNVLLREDCRIKPKHDDMLNTELRIFALIKLGITQSSHIASLLRYSVNTIYNYRAQIKNSVLEDRDDFEEKVKKIGSKQ